MSKPAAELCSSSCQHLTSHFTCIKVQFHILEEEKSWAVLKWGDLDTGEDGRYDSG